jgi:peroxiredoxin
MDLRTFLKPKRHSPASLPKLGERARSIPGVVLDAGRPSIVAFLRHVGCPFAEATMRELAKLSVERPAVQFVAVSHGTPAATRAWCKTLGVPAGVRVVDDPDGAIYAAWGVGLTTLRHFAGFDSLAAVTRLAARGVRNRHPSGSRWQSAAAFAVDRTGGVAWVHVPRHAGDLPLLAKALAGRAD